MKAHVKKVIGGAAIVIAGAFIAPWEGKRNTAYVDIAGVLTVCYGHTGPDVHRGLRVTDEECKRLLSEDLAEALTVVNRSVTAPMSEPRKAGLASFVFNVGETKFKRSTLLQMLNADHPAACDQLLRWIYVYDPVTGQYVVNDGIRQRRTEERELCLYE